MLTPNNGIYILSTPRPQITRKCVYNLFKSVTSNQYQFPAARSLHIQLCRSETRVRVASLHARQIKIMYAAHTRIYIPHLSGLRRDAIARKGSKNIPRNPRSFDGASSRESAGVAWLRCVFRFPIAVGAANAQPCVPIICVIYMTTI